MKVLMINGSARRKGNTFLALSEIAKQLLEKTDSAQTRLS